MTREEAIKNIKAYIFMEFENMSKQVIEALEKAIEDMEKQIPKNVRELNERKDLYVASCTTCNYLVYRNQRYCDGCGQALDWSEAYKGE